MDDIESLTKTLIQTKVVEALSNSQEYIDTLVKSAMSKEVNHYGMKPEYYDKKLPFLEWVAGDAIRNAVRSAVKERIAELEPQIKASVARVLSSDAVVTAFVNAILDATKERAWAIEINVSEPRP